MRTAARTLFVLSLGAIGALARADVVYVDIPDQRIVAGPICRDVLVLDMDRDGHRDFMFSPCVVPLPDGTTTSVVIVYGEDMNQLGAAREFLTGFDSGDRIPADGTFWAGQSTGGYLLTSLGEGAWGRPGERFLAVLFRHPPAGYVVGWIRIGNTSDPAENETAVTIYDYAYQDLEGWDLRAGDPIAVAPTTWTGIKRLYSDRAAIELP